MLCDATASECNAMRSSEALRRCRGSVMLRNAYFTSLMARAMGFSKVKLEVKKFVALSSTVKYIFIVFQCVGRFALASANRNTWCIE